MLHGIMVKRHFFIHNDRISCNMSSTTIPIKGNSSPEYAAIRGTFVSLTTLFQVKSYHTAVRLFQEGLIPQSPGSRNVDTTGLVDSVLSWVERDAIMFYKFLGVLNMFGADGNPELEAINKTFVGMCRHYNWHK